MSHVEAEEGRNRRSARQARVPTRTPDSRTCRVIRTMSQARSPEGGGRSSRTLVCVWKCVPMHTVLGNRAVSSSKPVFFELVGRCVLGRLEDVRQLYFFLQILCTIHFRSSQYLVLTPNFQYGQIVSCCRSRFDKLSATSSVHRSGRRHRYLFVPVLTACWVAVDCRFPVDGAPGCRPA